MGAKSNWEVELPTELRQFDYSTISDVILHFNYTAREDANLYKDSSFKESVVTYLKSFLSNAAEQNTQPLLRMFSMKHEFSTEWHKFLYPDVPGSDQILSVTLQKEHFRFFTKGKAINVTKIEVLMKANRTGEYEMVIDATNINNKAISSSEVSMQPNATYANMQSATLSEDSTNTNINSKEIDVYKPIALKFRYYSDKSNPPDPQRYNQIDTNPEEFSDLFIVFHYCLGKNI